MRVVVDCAFWCELAACVALRALQVGLEISCHSQIRGTVSAASPVLYTSGAIYQGLSGNHNLSLEQLICQMVG
jgi:hypothetical protein